MARKWTPTSDRETPIPWVEVGVGWSDELGAFTGTGLEMLDRCPGGEPHDIGGIIPHDIPHEHIFCHHCLRKLAPERIQPAEFYKEHGIFITRAADGVILVRGRKALVFKLARSAQHWRFLGPPRFEWCHFHGTFWQMLDEGIRLLNEF